MRVHKDLNSWVPKLKKERTFYNWTLTISDLGSPYMLYINTAPSDIPVQIFYVNYLLCILCLFIYQVITCIYLHLNNMNILHELLKAELISCKNISIILFIFTNLEIVTRVTTPKKSQCDSRDMTMRVFFKMKGFTYKSLLLWFGWGP